MKFLFALTVLFCSVSVVFGGSSSSALLSWLQSHGVDTSAVRVGDVATVQPQTPLPNGQPQPEGSLFSNTHTASAFRDGLYTTRHISENQHILSVPFNLLLNYSSPYSHTVPLNPLFNDMIVTAVSTGVVLDSQALLAARVLHQYQEAHELKKKGQPHADFWSHLIADLPSPSSVCFFTQDELAALNVPSDSPLFDARHNQLETIQEGYAAFVALLETKTEYIPLFPAGFSEKWFRWAYGLVLNSGVEVPVKDDEGIDGALLTVMPLLAHINHANPPQHSAKLAWTSSNDGHSGTIHLVANRALNAGEELLITYGSLSAIPVLRDRDSRNSTDHHQNSTLTHTGPGKNHTSSKDAYFTHDSFFPNVGLSNTQLLVHYGIALPYNEYERIALDIGLDSELHDKHLHEIKSYIIEVNDLDHGALVGIDGKLPAEFVHALRAKHLSVEDVLHLEKNEYEFLPEHGYLSLQNELKWHLQLVVSVENLLSVYPTTLLDDIALLDKTLMSGGRGAHASHIVHALAYRVTLKRILHALILRSLDDVSHLFHNISTHWTEEITKNDMEDVAQKLADEKGQPLSEEKKAEARVTWKQEVSQWKSSVQTWQTDMDKWVSEWNQWVRAVFGNRGLSSSLPKPIVPDGLEPHDEHLEPSVHPLSIDHQDEIFMEQKLEKEHLEDHHDREHDREHDDDHDDRHEAEEDNVEDAEKPHDEL